MALESPWKANFNQVWDLNGGVCREERYYFFGQPYQIHVCQQKFFRSSDLVPAKFKLSNVQARRTVVYQSPATRLNVGARAQSVPPSWSKPWLTEAFEPLRAARQ